MAEWGVEQARAMKAEPRTGAEEFGDDVHAM